MSTSFIRLVKFSIIFFSYTFSISCSLFLWHPHDVNVGTLELVPEAPYTILIFLILFSSGCSYWVFCLFVCLFFASLYSKSLI